MKICITAKDSTLGSQVDPRFGRCPYFIIVDSDSMDFEAIANNQTMAAGGAGIQAAQLVAGKNVGAVLTGNIGPNAYNALNAAGVIIMTDVSGVVKDAVDRYLAGEFETTQRPTVQSHFGMKNKE